MENNKHIKRFNEATENFNISDVSDSKLEYWFCLIGPTERKNLYSGSDRPMRMAVRDKFIDLTDEDCDVCASGWGVSQKKYEALRKVFSCPDNELGKFNL